MASKHLVIIALLLGAATTPAAAQPVDSRLLHTLHWRLLGPFRGGWASQIAGVPAKPDTFYFGAAGGGVWKTDDSGRTWRSVFDQGPSSAIGAIAVAPSDGEVIYAGGGQPEPRYDVEAGRGVYRSTDGGKSWTDLGLHDSKYIGSIWVDPRNADHVLVAAVGHYFGSSNSRGLYRSVNGGKSWAHVLAPGGYTGAVSIAADPKNPDHLFASTWEARQYPWQSYFTPIAGPGSGIWESADGGAHWARMTGGGWPEGPLGRISLAATRTARGLRLYAVVDSPKSGGLWRSDDGGAHWTKANNERAFAGYYFNRLTVDPRDPDVVYTTGQSIRRCAKGGTECTIVRGSPGGDDYHDIWINPLHPDHVATAADQGAAVSVNNWATFSDWYNQPTGQLYHLAVDDRFPYWIYSGQQDSGTVAIASRSDYGAPNLRDWHPVGGDERDYDIPDPADPTIVYASGLGGHVSRYDSTTGNVTDISPWPVNNYGLRPTLIDHHFYWVTPMVGSRAGPNSLYLGGDVLWRTTDRGDHWAIISPDLTGKQVGAARCIDEVSLADAPACGYGVIVSIQPSPSNPDEIWVGADSGVLSITRDAGKTWASAMVPGVKPWSKISSIDQSYSDPNTAYLALDGQRIDDFEPHVMRTHDGGKSWQNASVGLPAGEIVSVVRADPVRAGLLYAGTETGVFVSFDDGGSWQRLSGNLPTAWARDLLVKGDDLVVATQGRAIWILGNLALLRQVRAGDEAQALRLFTPGLAPHVRFNNNHDTPLAPETPVGENPPQGATIDYWLSRAPSGPVILDIRDSAGTVVRHFSSGDRPEDLNAERYFEQGWTRPTAILPAKPGMNRFVWDLHSERPKTVNYNYSIAAIWGTPTPITPEGPIMPPGRYTATLSADGRTQTVPIDVTADPRVKGANYAAATAFSYSLYAPMAKGWRGFAEMEAVKKELAERSKAASDPALKAAIEAVATSMEPSAVPNSGFSGASDTLAAVETNVEASDSNPSSALRAVAASAIAEIDAQWIRWQQLRSGELAALNRKLAAAGMAPVTVPAEAALGGGGAALPRP